MMWMIDLVGVQVRSPAEWLANLAVRRTQYPGTFRFRFNAGGWSRQIGVPVQLTFSPLGFAAKLFRVVEQTIRADGVTPLVLREENADIYAWDKSERPAVQPADANVYDPRLAPMVRAVSTDRKSVV